MRRPRLRSRTPRSGWRRRDGGSVAVETAILAPVLFGLIVLAIVQGRTDVAHHTVAVAAHDAARAASISRDQATACQRAQTVAATALADQGLACASSNIMADTSGFNVPVGQPAVVRVTVTCTLTFGDLGLPLSRELTATFVSPLDRWRGRGT